MSELHKYPRTFHLPQSLGKTSDDKTLKDTSHFYNKNVVITEKMDGENTSIYTNTFHARSLDSRHHNSRDWVARLQSTIGYKIPVGWRICGENLYAKHSIKYQNLPTYFLAFSVWNENNICLNWNDTLDVLKELSLMHPPVLYHGIYSDDIVVDLIQQLDMDKQEGFVVRLSEDFKYENFESSVAKFVRKNHVQTDSHWMRQKIEINGLIR